jgi:hypothetical protein
MHIFVLQSMTSKELHRCNHLPKVQPSSKEDVLAQPCTSWTWALRASQLSKMKLKSHNPKRALVLFSAHSSNSPLFFLQRMCEIEDYLALDLNFLNLLAGTKSLRTLKEEITSEKSHSTPWSRKCCRFPKKYNCA